jgi:ABC-type nitrate/sulfonate/bicarbonate transport system substrate-binding protein
VTAGPAPVRLGLFSPSLPHLVAIREGYYEERGVTVEQQRIPSSAGLLRALRDGDLDVALTSPDNIANFRLNQAGDGPVDARIIAAVDQAGSISLTGRPGVEAPGQIRHGTAAVDARNSGFAFLLYELLQSRGLAPDIDYRVLEAGGTPSRFAALLAGSFEATILNAGFDVRAQAEGGSLLIPTVDVIPDYLSTVLAARGEYLDQAPGPVARFVAGFRQAMNYCLDPARHADCTDLVVSEWQVSPDVAARMVDAAADARTGLVPDAVIRPAQLEVILELRQGWGGFSADVDIGAEIRRPRGLIDERFAGTG